jgi:hypothetical protein
MRWPICDGATVTVGLGEADGLAVAVADTVGVAVGGSGVDVSVAATGVAVGATGVGLGAAGTASAGLVAGGGTAGAAVGGATGAASAGATGAASAGGLATAVAPPTAAGPGAPGVGVGGAAVAVGTTTRVGGVAGVGLTIGKGVGALGTGATFPAGTAGTGGTAGAPAGRAGAASGPRTSRGAGVGVGTLSSVAQPLANSTNARPQPTKPIRRMAPHPSANGPATATPSPGGTVPPVPKRRATPAVEAFPTSVLSGHRRPRPA